MTNYCVYLVVSRKVKKNKLNRIFCSSEEEIKDKSLYMLAIFSLSYFFFCGNSRGAKEINKKKKHSGDNIIDYNRHEYYVKYYQNNLGFLSKNKKKYGVTFSLFYTISRFFFPALIMISHFMKLDLYCFSEVTNFSKIVILLLCPNSPVF